MIYGLGILGIQLSIGLVNSYQAEFFNKMLGADLMIIAAIILAAKFISIVADFVIGNVIDRSHLKGGKMRPWVLFSAFPLALFTMLMFVAFDFKSDIGMYFYIMFITVIWNVAMTFADIPSQGMLSLLTPDGDEINVTAGISNTLKSIALASPGVIVTVILFAMQRDYLDKTSYLVTAGLMCGVGFCLQLLMYFKSKENVVSSSTGSMSFREMFTELRHNKMLMIVFITFILGFARNIGMSIAVQSTYIFAREGVSMFGGSTLYGDGISWVFGITSAVSSMIVIVLNPVINKKLGEKKYFIAAALWGFAMSTIALFMYVFGGSPLRSFVAILIYQFFLGFSYGPNGFLPMVMVADIVDYQEWKTGKRTEGTQFAVLSLANKLSNALSVAIGIFLIGAIGFNASTAMGYINQGSAYVTANISNYITNSMQNKAWVIYFFLPGLSMLASAIPMLFYKIDKKTKIQMRAELAERRAAAALAAEGADGSSVVLDEDAGETKVFEEDDAEITNDGGETDEVVDSFDAAESTTTVDDDDNE